MKTLVTTFKTLLLSFLFISFANAQNVGVATTSPDAPFHVGSSGQVLTPGGLMLLGHRSEAHLELDFNRIQSLFSLNATPISLLLQPDGGKVGIATNSPDAPFHVSSSGQVWTPGGLMLLGNRSEVHLEMDFNRIQSFSTALANPVSLLLQPDGGNVGVGISNPNSKLHVNGAATVGESGDGLFQIGDPTGFHLRFDGNEILARNNDAPALLYFQYWSGNLSLCQNDLGKVGIGTTNPTAKVQITDGDDVTLSGGGQLVLGLNASTNIAMDGNEIQARNNGVAAPLFLQAGGGDVLLSPFENGQVGIGVTSSANMPSDDYLLAVDGKIISEEVRVEVSGSWPDYVFNDDYVLTPLDLLESRIKEKGHLPGIPSAKEVEENGIELGDMQKRLMEKIEELTLYVIDLKKEIEAIKQQKNVGSIK